MAEKFTGGGGGTGLLMGGTGGVPGPVIPEFGGSLLLLVGVPVVGEDFGTSDSSPGQRAWVRRLALELSGVSKQPLRMQAKIRGRLRRANFCIVGMLQKYTTNLKELCLGA